MTTPTLWTADQHEESFHCTTQDQAIEEYLDACGPLVSRVLTVVGYRPREIDQDFIKSLASQVVDRVIQDLDEEYSDGADDPGYQGTDEHRAAAEALAVQLVQQIVTHFHVWQCEECCRVEVDTLHWIRLHRPDWLEMRNGKQQVEVAKQ